MSSKCLSCQISDAEKPTSGQYHPKCSIKLFGTRMPPTVPFKSTDIAAEAQKMVGRMSISGAQPKLSVIHVPKSHRLMVVERGGLYILKPPNDQFFSLPENENLCMNIAALYGVEVPPHGLLPLLDKRPAYVVKRFDRLSDGTKLQQEDFQQLLQTDDKYAGSYERIANFLKENSSVPVLDLVRLFERAILFFVLGNGDAHLKNFSLIKTEEVGYQLSPAYDIVNSRLVLPNEKEEMCLSLLGKKNNITKQDLLELSDHFGLNRKQAQNSLDRLYDIKIQIETMIDGSFLSETLKQGFLSIFEARMSRLFD